MKKFIRALIKIPATPFVLFWFFISLIAGIIIMMLDWLYEDKSLYESTWVLRELAKEIKTWFTTI